MERRLAAILMADVVGYSRLMQQDEAGTLALLRERHGQVLEPLIAAHGGRVAKLMGDGLLAEFASAVKAVECAVALQEQLGQANAALPEASRLVLRIGVNLGDVMVEAGDLYGDTVNIAARLEALAPPGGIVVSAAVHEQVRGKLALAFVDRGRQQLKNLSEPLQVFALGGAAADTGALPPAAPDRPTVAVLPFENWSQDAGQDYFSDGITADIITELQRFRHVAVLSRHASFRLRGQALEPAEVGRRLGVRYLVEGNVRRGGGRVRITAQLVEAASGQQVWADRYDRDEAELLQVQDELVRTIVSTLVGRLKASETQLAKRKPPSNLSAYDCVLRGNALPQGDPASDLEAQRLFERAIALDPDYALAHTLLAFTVMQTLFHGAAKSEAVIARAEALARRALALDETEALGHLALGWILLERRAFRQAEDHYGRALTLNPNSAIVMANLADLQVFLGRPRETLEWLRRARSVDPYFEPSWYWRVLGRAHFLLGDYAEARQAFERSPTRPFLSLVYLAACGVLLGEAAWAAGQLAAARCLRPDAGIAEVAAIEPYRNAADAEPLLAALRQAGLPD